ncbi:MAG: hypothetical protein WBD99_15920 [Thermodesulfobacteriota bacterium]
MSSLITLCFVLGLYAGEATGQQRQLPTLSKEELRQIGNRIYINECGGKAENLVAWNEGEEFPSLGIGHFIWYPPGKEGPFRETFPTLLEFYKSSGIEPPSWIGNSPNKDSPWNSRQEFTNDLNSKRMIELRQFLIDTIPLQTAFLVNRFQISLDNLLEYSPKELHDHIKTQFFRVANSPMGMYALIDYVNFKGEGTNPSERYMGEGWGLLQVLDEMNGTETGIPAVNEFVEAAEKVLASRVENSPPERNEKRWLPGWKNRLSTYIPKITNDTKTIY